MSSFPYDVDFEVVKEGWNHYELSDGSTLRLKLTLGKVITDPGVPPERSIGYSFQTQVMVVAYTTQDKKGTPSGQVFRSPQELNEAVVEDLDFEETKISVNEYLLENGVRIKLRIMLTRVGKTDQFTRDGSPLYTVQHQMVPQIKVPKNFPKGRTRKKSGKSSMVV